MDRARRRFSMPDSEIENCWREIETWLQLMNRHQTMVWKWQWASIIGWLEIFFPVHSSARCHQSFREEKNEHSSQMRYKCGAVKISSICSLVIKTQSNWNIAAIRKHQETLFVIFRSIAKRENIWEFSIDVAQKCLSSRKWLINVFLLPSTSVWNSESNHRK